MEINLLKVMEAQKCVDCPNQFIIGVTRHFSRCEECRKKRIKDKSKETSDK
jgi:hypothetical protein